MSEVTVDRLVKAYIKIRDKRAQLKAEFEATDTELKQQLEALESELLEMCKETGADSFKTAYGTATRTVQTNYWPTDWASMHKWILDRERPDLLQRRLSQSEMKKYLEEHPDDMPPGLNIDSKYTITIRRRS